MNDQTKRLHGGAVEVCPECDIAGCRHIRARAALAAQPAASAEPSDEEIMDVWMVSPQGPHMRDQLLGFARALLSRYAAPQASSAAVQKAIAALQDAYDNAAKVSGSALLAGEVKGKAAREEQYILVYHDACAALVGIGSALHTLKSAPAAEAECCRCTPCIVPGKGPCDKPYQEDSAKGAGDDFPSDLPGQLREYASNSGYSHQDYADTMREAADALDRQQRGGDNEIAECLRDLLRLYDERAPLRERPWVWEAARAALAAHKPERSALDQYMESMEGCDEPSSVERLRFFCSLAMSGRDWLDVEPFFDAATHEMLDAQKADGGDAPWADWMGCESRRPFVMNTLRSNAEKMRSAEKRARTAYRQDFMGAPCRYLAAVYGKAAALFEAQIAAIDAALAATKGESNE